MNAIPCAYEAVVMNSARTGSWDTSVTEHVKACSYCREIVQTVELMGKLAGIEKEPLIPSAEHVWLNARLRAMQEARERALRPLLLISVAARIVCMLVFATGMVWIWSKIQSASMNSLSTSLHLPPSIALSITALAACIIAILVLRLAQPMLIEE